MATCEWNPREDRLAHSDDPPHAEAVLSVGGDPDNFHLCEGCAQLPRFARKRRRVRLKGTP
jgi:hypothetical protein